MTLKEIVKKSEDVAPSSIVVNTSSVDANPPSDRSIDTKLLDSLAAAEGEPEDEADTESALGRLMQQMQQVRENAKKGIAAGTMTDSERRAMAAEMAMKMMAMFGAGMDDDEEEEEDGGYVGEVAEMD
jgi:hypothetical protein